MSLHLKLLDIDHPLSSEESKLRQIEAHALIYLSTTTILLVFFLIFRLYLSQKSHITRWLIFPTEKVTVIKLLDRIKYIHCMLYDKYNYNYWTYYQNLERFPH